MDYLDRLAVPQSEYQKDESVIEVLHRLSAPERERMALERLSTHVSSATGRVVQAQFAEFWDVMAEDVHALAVEKGWWVEDRNDGEIIALLHSELSEALEALRNGNPPSEKIPEFSSLEEELADAVIRIMDYASVRQLRVGAAIVAKHAFNTTRPYKHGKKF